MLIKPLADFSFERAPLSDLSVKKSLDRSSSVQYFSSSTFSPSSLARWIAFGSLSWFPQHIQTFRSLSSFLSPLFPFSTFHPSLLPSSHWEESIPVLAI